MREGTELPTVRAAFILVGFSEDPEEISSLLKTTPSELGRAGESKRIANGERVHTVKESYWELVVTLGKSSFSIENYVSAVVERVEGFSLPLATLPASVVRKILVQVSVAKSGSIPGLYMSADLLDRLAQLNVAIDIDIN